MDGAVEHYTCKSIITAHLSFLVGLKSEGTLSLGVSMPIDQSINVQMTTDRNTAKSAKVPRTCSANQPINAPIDWSRGQHSSFRPHTVQELKPNIQMPAITTYTNRFTVIFRVAWNLLSIIQQQFNSNWHWLNSLWSAEQCHISG